MDVCAQAQPPLCDDRAPLHTVGELKQRLEPSTSCAPIKFDLFYESRQLRNEESMADARVSWLPRCTFARRRRARRSRVWRSAVHLEVAQGTNHPGPSQPASRQPLPATKAPEVVPRLINAHFDSVGRVTDALNSGYFCKKVLPDALSTLQSRAPNVIGALAVVMDRMGDFLAGIAPRFVTVVRSHLDAAAATVAEARASVEKSVETAAAEASLSFLPVLQSVLSSTGLAEPFGDLFSQILGCSPAAAAGAEGAARKPTPLHLIRSSMRT